MYIELMCRTCKKTFRVDFSNQEYDVHECPHCACSLNYSDVTRVRAITEPFYTNVGRLDSIGVCGIHIEENRAVGTAIIADNLFSLDMTYLDEIYRSASPEVQSKLAALIDVFYLLVNRDSQDGNVECLDVVLETLDNLFKDKVNEKHKKTAQMLGLE